MNTQLFWVSSMSEMSDDLKFIRLRGVRQNNLKNLDLDLPLGKLIAVTGLSGSGKSSLVFETLHAEGQRRYVETFSPYTRQFLELLDRPKVDSIENIPPSIAIEQTNTVRNSRSTIGTMTELCDFFKVWFASAAELFDPATGEKIEDDNPSGIWKKLRAGHPNQEVLLAFAVVKPDGLEWDEILQNLQKQGYTRALVAGVLQRLEGLGVTAMAGEGPLFIIQDRLALRPQNRARFLEAAEAALHYGRGEMVAFSQEGVEVGRFCQGLKSPVTQQRFRAPSPALFSFNSPLGACPRCRGFGRIIEIDYRLAIPDQSLTLREGAIKPWLGEVYGESQKDLIRAARKRKLPLDVPFSELSSEEQDFVIRGEPGYRKVGKEWPNAWYGVKGFFDWLETKVYKMHVRIFLAKYRAYVPCPDCGGTRLQPESLYWKWQDRTLPTLYQTPISELLPLLRERFAPTGNRQVDIAYESILSRLGYLDQVGLGYLTLDRSSRTLSGGEVERVNLTACLGTSLVDTLFVLDEPSVGLHGRDIDRLVAILRRLTEQGNTVVVVEHDEAIIAAADEIIEIGPKPGRAGGELVFQGNREALLRSDQSLTGRYLSGRLAIDPPAQRRPAPKPRAKTGWLKFLGASKHNLHQLDVLIPLRRFVCLSGVSGSGKSTLLQHVIYEGLQRHRGQLADDPADIRAVQCQEVIDEVVLVDQSPLSRTPRSNPALYCDAWDEIRKLYAGTDVAQGSGLTASSFSFNAGDGRCDHCKGLGYERVEMQFLSDVFVTCPVCEGQRFKPEVLEVIWNGRSISEVLGLTVDEAATFFAEKKLIAARLRALQEVGLGYLTLGQPLNTLSGGESQRLKLVRYLPQLGRGRTSGTPAHALLLLDEPTTGLHRDDIKRLIGVLQKLVEEGHSLIVIEHQTDVIKSADWVIEMGPEAGSLGGQIVAAGPPEVIARSQAPTAPFLQAALAGPAVPVEVDFTTPLLAAEDQAAYGQSTILSPARRGVPSLQVTGAREHNLKNINVAIRHQEITVITGVSGSGKSTLAFDIIFAEGQRRFLESMSAYARQFVEQLPRPDIDSLTGIPPTVAIEQRVTSGNRKSTVATVTEVAQYLRLLYARAGVQHSPVTGEPVASLSPAALSKRMEQVLAQPGVKKMPHLYLCAPLIRGRKGHHQPIATWIAQHGYEKMRVDGRLIEVARFTKLDRYREHDIEVVIADFQPSAAPPTAAERSRHLEDAVRLGKGSCFLLDGQGEILTWFSTTRTDPVTGEAFPELDPKHFSFNSSRGWCPECRGYGRLYPWLFQDDEENAPPMIVEPDSSWNDEAPICNSCQGQRLNPVSRAVKLYFTDGSACSLPELLRMSASDLVASLRRLRLDSRGRAIVAELLPQIEERLHFLDEVGLSYLNLDRSAQTLSGGEAQRIRLAAQLGSNLSGVLYVLDEPSIGLHARDNHRLIDALQELRAKGNTLVIVEHDEDTMRHADSVIDLGPAAGRHGGEILAQGTIDEITRNPASLTGHYLKTGIKHPLMGHYRPLPTAPGPRQRKITEEWLVLRQPSLRNLKGDDLSLPIGRLTMVCGVSGAGKSTLVRDLLLPAVRMAAERGESILKGSDWGGEGAAPFHSLHHGNRFNKVIEVDQTPIGKTPRSTPATYLGIFDVIRKVFAGLPEAKMRGYNAGRFSFNTAHGRCETCQGAGRIKFEMNFLPDAFLPCDDCGGNRYGPELQEIRWKDKSIGDVLQMTFEEARDFFDFHSQLSQACQLMVDTGLGYLSLGQSSPTLSGGEAQRLKLVSEVMKGLPTYKEKTRGLHSHHLFMLEEPTIGLHFTDCEKLIRLLHRLVDLGHTIVVIEHNLDLIAEADYVVEIGPEGGEAGGTILYQGDVAGLISHRQSPTAPFLKTVFR